MTWDPTKWDPADWLSPTPGTLLASPSFETDIDFDITPTVVESAIEATPEFEVEFEFDISAIVLATRFAAPEFKADVELSVALTIVIPGAIPYTTVEPSFDDSNLWTEVVITRAGSEGSIIVTDQAAVDEYGEDGSLQLKREGLWSDDNQAQSVGERLLARYSEPHLRFPSIVPVRSSDLWGRLLSLRVNDRITIRKQPRKKDGTPLGAIISQECWISGIKWNVNRDAKRWNLTLDVVPAEAPINDLFVVGTSALGSTDKLAW